MIPTGLLNREAVPLQRHRVMSPFGLVRDQRPHAVDVPGGGRISVPRRASEMAFPLFLFH
jgi:hypothetical protein